MHEEEILLSIFSLFFFSWTKLKLVVFLVTMLLYDGLVSVR